MNDDCNTDVDHHVSIHTQRMHDHHVNHVIDRSVVGPVAWLAGGQRMVGLSGWTVGCL